MQQIEPMQEMWVVIDKSGHVNPETISPYQKWAMERHTERTEYNWKDMYKMGFRCIKVDITFTPVKK